MAKGPGAVGSTSVLGLARGTVEMEEWGEDRVDTVGHDQITQSCQLSLGTEKFLL
jgi:hypothetical protein